MTSKTIRSEDAAEYQSHRIPGMKDLDSQGEDMGDAVIEQAIEILHARLGSRGPAMGEPQAVKDYLALSLAGYPYEVFGMLTLDNRHRLIRFAELFRGTIDGASVHPREVVRECIADNAAAVIFAHNHPSGATIPSNSDIRITRRLTEALSLIDVRVLDHVIVGCDPAHSMAERGEL